MYSFFCRQTHTQAERKIMEARMESAIREMSTANLSESEMKAKLAELASQKPCPYGTFLAVSAPLFFLNQYNENKNKGQSGFLLEVTFIRPAKFTMRLA